MSVYPPLGLPTLLVYRECVNGHWCATGEGACAPTCGECGERMWPGGGVPGQFGPEDDRLFGRRERGLAFIGVLVNEAAAVRPVSRVSKFVGGFVHEYGRRTRYFSESEQTRDETYERVEA